MGIPAPYVQEKLLVKQLCLLSSFPQARPSDQSTTTYLRNHLRVRAFGLAACVVEIFNWFCEMDYLNAYLLLPILTYVNLTDSFVYLHATDCFYFPLVGTRYSGLGIQTNLVVSP